MLRYSVFDTAWGSFGFVASAGRLLATFLPGPGSSIGRAIAQGWPDAIEAEGLLPRFRQQVIYYFVGKRTRFTGKIELSGVSPFRRAVLERCRAIPYGRTVSYVDLARAADRPNAARAVGGVMARNPLPLVIPCHRVLRADGSLGGFSTPSGIEDKERLLRLEGVLAST